MTTLTLALALLFSPVISTAQIQSLKCIATVTQRGSFLCVYNARGTQLSVIAAGDGLVGYTQSSVSVRRGDFIYIFDANGKQTSVIPSGAK
jgi:hypothetical protein